LDVEVDGKEKINRDKQLHSDKELVKSLEMPVVNLDGIHFQLVQPM
jgi:hypothetical protein